MSCIRSAHKKHLNTSTIVHTKTRPHSVFRLSFHAVLVYSMLVHVFNAQSAARFLEILGTKLNDVFCSRKVNQIIYSKRNFKGHKTLYSTLNLLIARVSACPVMTKYGPCIYTGYAFKWLTELSFTSVFYFMTNATDHLVLVLRVTQ